MPVTHAGLTVSHLPNSTTFYLATLQPLGYRYIGQWGPQIGFGHKEPDFFLTQEMPGMKAGGGHVAFSAPNRAAVHNFFASAIEAGGRSNGKPAQRYDGDDCFNAAVLDFDGNSIEVVFHEDEAHRHVASESRASRVLGWREDVEESLENGESIANRTRAAPSVASYKSSTRSVSYRSVPAKSVVSVKNIQSAAISAAHQSLLTPQSVAQTSSALVTLEPRVSAKSVLSTLTQSVTNGDPSTASMLLGDSKIEMSTKTLAGTLLGAAAGAAVAYAMCKSEEDSARSEQEASIAASQRRSIQLIESPYLNYPATPSHTPATSQFDTRSRYSGMRAIQAPPVPLSAYTGQLLPPSNLVEYLPTLAPSQVSGSQPAAPSQYTLARSARRPAATVEDAAPTSAGPSVHTSSHHTRSETTKSRAESKASSRGSGHTTSSTRLRAAAQPASHAGPSSRAHSATASKTSSEVQSDASKRSISSIKSNRRGSTSSKASAAKVSGSKPSSRVLGNVAEVEESMDQSDSPPADHTAFIGDQDELETVAPSDSISCAGSSRRSKTSKRSKSKRSDASSSRHSEKSSKASSRKTRCSSGHKGNDDSSSEETVTPRKYKDRSAVSLPIRAITPGMMKSMEGRSMKSYAG